ncbi:MAG: peptide-methionine (R)-S-oxide reductase [Chthoniobacterales bacterium]|nr:MAG: peptide-methionine (R)-S-oxide reductase [Chthoniobacterales bacterium]
MYGGRITSEEKSTLGTYVLVLVLTVLGVAGIYFFILAREETKAMVGFDPKRPVPTDATLKRRLKPEQYNVVREGGTETAFQNEFWENQRPGLYVDVITGEPLFTSLDKFDGGTGRPTFTKPISKDLLTETPDNSHDMQRTEVRAKRSNAHLGHFFPDPTSPTGVRYAVNSAAFRFIPQEQMKAQGYEAFLPLFDKK